MSIIKRIAISKKMKKNINIVKKMTGKMKFDENMVNVNWKRVRFICNFGYQFMPKEKGIKFEKIDLDGISAIMSIPKVVLSDGIILYIHGGGFVSGSAKSTKGYCSMLAKYTQCRVVSIDYRLSPEYEYPCALDDCFKAYREIQKLYPNSKIAVVGESAGGNLCFALTVRCINNDVMPPSCIVSHSGVFDFTGSLDRDYDIDDFTVTTGVYKAMKSLYSPNNSMSNPEISPIFYKDISKFPPTVFTCDFKETVKIDSVEMYKKMEKYGIDVTLYEYENTFHAFAPIGTMALETTQLLEENAEFIKKYIS